MADPYLGEIRLVAFNKDVTNFVPCDGRLLNVFTHSQLFILLGTTYGGDGVNTFGVPDLRGRTPIHFGVGGGETYALGDTAGFNSVTLRANQTPAHTHTVQVSDDSATQKSVNNSPSLGNTQSVPSPAVSNSIYCDPNASGTTQEPLFEKSISPAGGTTQGGPAGPHENVQPSIGLRYMIATSGIWPSPG